MTQVPYVELSYAPAPLSLAARQQLTAPREQRSISDAINDALLAWRTHLVTEAREEAKKFTTLDAITINKLVDKIWANYTPRFSALLVPYLIQGYASGFARANAGQVPAEYLDSLARDYALKLGSYFHGSSKEALIQGFQTYVNRRMAVKVAFDRALMAYGLTPRQMSGYTSAVALDAKVNSADNLQMRQRRTQYISESIRQRLAFLTKQEEHNLDQQATQMAWMWMERRGKLSRNAMKTWITAKDERVCPLCGPLHGMKIPVLEKFPVGEGSLWMPGVHPNCRCEVRLTQRLTAVSKADKWYNDEYNRTRDGRFAARRGQQLPEPPVIEAQEVIRPAPDTTPVIETTPELKAAPEKPKLVGKPKLVAKPKLVNVQRPALQAKPELQAPPALVRKPVERPELVSAPALSKPKLIGDITRLLTHTKLEPAPPHRGEVFRRRGAKIVYSPTIKIEDVSHNPMPLYAVLPGHLVAHHDHLDLDPLDPTEFTPSEEQAANDAADLFEQNIDDVVDRIRTSEESKIPWTTDDGTEVEGTIEYSDVYNVVSFVANQLGSDDPDWHGEGAMAMVVWHTLEGEEIGSGQIPYHRVIEHWQLDPQMFEVAIIKLQEGHDSSLGHTTQTQAGTQYGHETWQATGRYLAHQQPVSGGVFKVPVSLYDIVPDVELYDVPPEMRSEGDLFND